MAALDMSIEVDAIAEAVVKKMGSERPLSEWTNEPDGIPRCKMCGYYTPYDRAIDDYEYGNYCPKCGRRMKKGYMNED